ncbi:MAG: YihY/virulence factor BrkB family protein [Flammeovirgaceae bacterium]
MNLLKKIYLLLKNTIRRYFADDCLSYSSSIAFYTIFSLPALLIFVVLVAGTVFGEDSVKDELLKQIEVLAGEESAGQVENIIENVRIEKSTFFAKIVGFSTLIFSATTVFVSIQKSLNRIWGVKPKPKREYIKLFLDRLLSFALVISFGFIMLTSLIIDAVLSIFEEFIVKIFSKWAVRIADVINFSTTFLVITLIFGLIFKVLPDAKVSWRKVWYGASFSAMLFILGKYLMIIYLGNSPIGTTYGAAGSFVIILMWVYYASAVLLFGAEFTHVLYERQGIAILPKKGAVKVKIIENTQEE